MAVKVQPTLVEWNISGSVRKLVRLAGVLFLVVLSGCFGEAPNPYPYCIALTFQNDAERTIMAQVLVVPMPTGPSSPSDSISYEKRLELRPHQGFGEVFGRFSQSHELRVDYESWTHRQAVSAAPLPERTYLIVFSETGIAVEETPPPENVSGTCAG